MTLLSDRDLLTAMDEGELRVTPYARSQVQPASIDVRLGPEFLVFDPTQRTHVDPIDPPAGLTRLVMPAPREPFMLHPGQFVLGCTAEWVRLGPGLAARLEGKSSLGRLGLLTHSTAGFIDPGFSGQITLELANVSVLPIALWPGMLIGQLCVLRMSSPAEVPYGSPGLGSHYQNQQGPTASRVGGEKS